MMKVEMWWRGGALIFFLLLLVVPSNKAQEHHSTLRRSSSGSRTNNYYHDGIYIKDNNRSIDMKHRERDFSDEMMNNETDDDHHDTHITSLTVQLPPQKLAKIINGNIASNASSRYPYMVRVTRYFDTSPPAGNNNTGQQKKEGMTLCGGALIAPNVVLTAGHCLRYGNQKVTEVEIGRMDLNDASEVFESFQAKQVILHPEFEAEYMFQNDLGLVLLNGFSKFTPVKIDGGFSNSVLDPYDNTYDSNATSSIKDVLQLTVTGWGDTTGNGTFSSSLLETQMSFLTNELCAEKVPAWNIKPEMFCAYNIDRFICRGDSGGPSIVPMGGDGGTGSPQTDVLVGIVSFGSSECNSLTVFSRVSFHNAWINDYLCQWAPSMGCIPSISPSTTPRPSITQLPSYLPSISSMPSEQCADVPGFIDLNFRKCLWYNMDTSRCSNFSSLYNYGYNGNSACCSCGGGTMQSFGRGQHVGLCSFYHDGGAPLSQQSGIMFTVRALKHNNIAIQSFDLHIVTNYNDNDVVILTIYTKEGTYVGFENDANAWQSHGERVQIKGVGGRSIYTKTSTPPKSFEPIYLQEMSTKSLYLSLDKNYMVSSKGTLGGKVILDNNHMRVFSGIGKVTTRNPFGLQSVPALWNGNIWYSVATDVPTPTPTTVLATKTPTKAAPVLSISYIPSSSPVILDLSNNFPMYDDNTSSSAIGPSFEISIGNILALVITLIMI